MSDEARINVATGFQGGVSVSVRADSPEELNNLLAGISQHAHLAQLFGPVLEQVSEQRAVANVQAAFPKSNVVPFTPNVPVATPQSTVGQAPQPAQPNVVPPGVAYPGDCMHGPRQYRDSMARGRRWQRFECAIPWSRETASQRCQAVNV